jgi:hypothetical protein
MACHLNILENLADAYFDQHIVRSSHGDYWVADEADYGTDLPDFRDQIVFTMRSNRSDEG